LRCYIALYSTWTYRPLAKILDKRHLTVGSKPIPTLQQHFSGSPENTENLNLGIILVKLVEHLKNGKINTSGVQKKYEKNSKLMSVSIHVHLPHDGNC
jgi:hypothetical protein